MRKVRKWERKGNGKGKEMGKERKWDREGEGKGKDIGKRIGREGKETVRNG